MDNFVLNLFSSNLSDFEIDKNEIYRYMGIKGDCDNNTEYLVNECLKNISDILDLKLCYMFLPTKTHSENVNFDIFNAESINLVKNIGTSDKCILFGATIGQGIDRLIIKHSQISPVTALAYQAIGTEIIEKFCDHFEVFIKNKYNIGLHPRFSPGYGDLPITIQRKIFDILKPEKNCGITLNDNYIMRPSKSVTGFIAIGECKNPDHNKCLSCNKLNCEYKKEL